MKDLKPKTDLEFQLDLEILVTNRRVQKIRKILFGDMKKKASYAMLVAAVLCAIGPTISICANSDADLKQSNSTGALSQQQGADMLTLQTFQTSPFVTNGGTETQDGFVEHTQTFEALERDLSIKSNYALFQQAAQAVLNQSGLCGGAPVSSLSSDTPDPGNQSPDPNDPDAPVPDPNAQAPDPNVQVPGNPSPTPDPNAPPAPAPVAKPSCTQSFWQYWDNDGDNHRVPQGCVNDSTGAGVSCSSCDPTAIKQVNDIQDQCAVPTSSGTCTNLLGKSTKLITPATVPVVKVASQAKPKKSGGVLAAFNKLLNGLTPSPAYAGSIEDILKDCANNKPDEFATVSNMLRTYFEWQSSELRTVSGYYQNKITSPILRDRIEGRLVQECLRQQLVTKDTAAAMDYCRKPTNWPVEKTFYAQCSNGSTAADNSQFDYKDYVKSCILSNVVKESLGANLYFDMIPNFAIAVDKTGVTFRSTPFTETPASVYHLIYDQTYTQLSSSWFQNFATQGCIPSVFAPSDFADKVIAKDPSITNYYSICLPQKMLESLNGLPKVDREFFNSVLAKRIAMIQVIELLNGSTMIAEETHRNLMAADREVGTLVESFPRYMSSLEKMYKDQVDLVHSKKLDDVLDKIESLMSKYTDEASSSQQGQTDTIDELVRMKNRRANGE